MEDNSLKGYGRTVTVCQMCHSNTLSLILDLGHQPHSDSFPTKAQLSEPEVRYPLRLVSCDTCGLIQIDYYINPVILYQQDYLYASSTTDTGKKHYTDTSKYICDLFAVPKDSLIVDIGSNTGVLLEGFKTAGMKVLGVDPASAATKSANEKGIETILDFFSLNLSKQIEAKYGRATIITGTNVFAHMHDLDDAVAGMKHLLAEKGVIVIEAPHVLPLIEHGEYDTIYHQHIGYLSARPMQAYLKRVGLELFDIQELPIHGGSLRYLVGMPGEHTVTPAIEAIIRKEEAFGLYTPSRLASFAKDVVEQKKALLELMLSLKKAGKKIIALSAPAKGNTLLNYCQLDRTFLDYATEKNPLKIGRFTPGTHIPIYSDDRILKDMPDYALILAWNFGTEIMKNMEEYRRAGGSFIIPIPMPHVIK